MNADNTKVLSAFIGVHRRLNMFSSLADVGCHAAPGWGCNLLPASNVPWLGAGVRLTGREPFSRFLEIPDVVDRSDGLFACARGHSVGDVRGRRTLLQHARCGFTHKFNHLRSLRAGVAADYQ